MSHNPSKRPRGERALPVTPTRQRERRPLRQQPRRQSPGPVPQRAKVFIPDDDVPPLDETLATLIVRDAANPRVALDQPRHRRQHRLGEQTPPRERRPAVENPARDVIRPVRLSRPDELLEPFPRADRDSPTEHRGLHRAVPVVPLGCGQIAPLLDHPPLQPGLAPPVRGRFNRDGAPLPQRRRRRPPALTRIRQVRHDPRARLLSAQVAPVREPRLPLTMRPPEERLRGDSHLLPVQISAAPRFYPPLGRARPRQPRRRRRLPPRSESVTRHPRDRLARVLVLHERPPLSLGVGSLGRRLRHHPRRVRHRIGRRALVQRANHRGNLPYPSVALTQVCRRP